MNGSQKEDLLRKIMEVERKFSAEKKNAKSDRRAELKQLIDRFALEAEKNAASES